MIEQLRDKGFGYGTGFLSPNCEKFIVSIPKNASSFMLDWCTHNGWSNAVVGDSCDWHKVTEMIVVLRDPLDRWVSGIAQYITGYILNVTGAYSWNTGPGPNDQIMSGDEFVSQYNPVVERFLFDNLNRHDDHVWPQIDFFESLLPDVPRKYFYLDQHFDHKFSQYLSLQSVQHLDTNSGDSNPNTKIIQQFVQQRLTVRPELKQRVIKSYARDYEFIKKIFHD